MAPAYSLSLLSLLLLLSATSSAGGGATSICVIGSGIAGSSLSFFLKNYTSTLPLSIDIFEKRGRIGGRTTTIEISGDEFEAGASIIHAKNLHALRFAELLGLDRTTGTGSDWFGIWDGSDFVFKNLKPPPESSSAIYKKLYEIADSLLLLKRYGISLLRMDRFVKKMVGNFMLYYKGQEERPVFETVEEMLNWSDLYSLTQRTLQEELTDAGLNSRTITELVTVITRINYGQSVSISGLAGAVSLAGSDPGLWSIKGGNCQLAEGLIKITNSTLHLNEGIVSILDKGDSYILKSNNGNEYNCDVSVIATPLDEIKLKFEGFDNSSVLIPNRKMQHTYTTFVRGILDPKYFGLKSVSEIPDLVGTLEITEIPFSCIAVLKKYGELDIAYKIFSRSELSDSLLDQIFSARKVTKRINWPAYPKYEAPEIFAPIILDNRNLYYINTFESAASCVETSAVAAENVARLIISRILNQSKSNIIGDIPSLSSISNSKEILHTDL